MADTEHDKESAIAVCFGLVLLVALVAIVGGLAGARPDLESGGDPLGVAWLIDRAFAHPWYPAAAILLVRIFAVADGQ